MLRPSFRVLAQHARSPSIHFPDRAQAHHSSRGPHPCAPQDVVSASEFLKSLPAERSDIGGDDPSVHSHSSYGGSSTGAQGADTASKPLLGPAGGQDANKRGFEGQASSSQGPRPDYDELTLPEWLKRSRYAPQEQELDAVMSGGASQLPELTKQYKQKWYTAQI